MAREAGILLPIFSLPSKYGIGCFSKEAYDFVDWLKDAGQTYWLTLHENCGTSHVVLVVKRPGFGPWVWKISRRREWQPTPVFLPGEFHGQWSLAGYSL